MLNKTKILWTKDEKEKVHHILKVKYLIVNALSINEYNYRISKEIWDTFKLSMKILLKSKAIG